MKEITYRIPECPVRIALLTDFHNAPSFDFSPLQQRKPQLICIAGDAVYGKDPLGEQKNVLPFLRACCAVAPTFMSLGNHEQGLETHDLREIRETGTVLLDNSWVKMDGIAIGGLTSAYVTERRKYGESRQHGEHKPETKWLEAFAAADGYHILLSHHPEYYALIPEAVDLVLCGHAHGGQIRLFHHGLFAPGQGWWPKYTKGVYGGRMVVSAGLTNTARAVPRLFNPCEIVYVAGTGN